MSLSQNGNDALQQFETIWNHVECGITIIDIETREILDINPVAARMFGTSKEQIVGHRCHKFICPTEMRNCPIMDKGQTVDRSERKFVTADGTLIPILKSVAKITYRGRPALLESFTDLTPLKSVEEKLAEESARERDRLKNVLNGMDALICVADSDTNRILFLNDRIRQNFGIEGDGVGELCHKLLQGRDEPCEGCPHQRLKDEPDKMVVWEHNESIKGAVLHKAAALIDWPGVDKAHLEYAIDITELRQAQKNLEQREKMLNALNRAAGTLLSRSEETFEETITEGCFILGDMASLDRLSVWKNSAQADGLHISQIYRWDRAAGGSTSPHEALQDTTFAQFVPGWEKILAAGESINGPVRLLPGSETLVAFGSVSVFANPVFINNSFWGFVICEDLRRERVFTENEADILRSAAFMLANVVMRHEETILIRETNERVKAQAHWYRSILDATPIPISVTDENMRWTLVNKAVETMLGTDYKDMIGQPCSNWNAHICGTENCGIACVKRGTTRTFFNQQGSSYQVDIGTLKDMEGKLTGFIEVVQDITQVETLARRQGEMEQSISQLEQQVDKIFYDPLTGIYSRRFFEENMERLIRSLGRAGGVLSVMMVDIDFFKQYNDTYGHIQGDDCLKIVAETLKNCMMRKDDFVARFGGEEFVIILPNTDGAGAQLIAARILEEVRNRKVPHAKSSVADCVTVSIGVVSGLVMYNSKRDDFLTRADEMLYQSKQGGRNRCSFANLD